MIKVRLNKLLLFITCLSCSSCEFVSETHDKSINMLVSVDTNNFTFQENYYQEGSLLFTKHYSYYEDTTLYAYSFVNPNNTIHEIMIEVSKDRDFHPSAIIETSKLNDDVKQYPIHETYFSYDRVAYLERYDERVYGTNNKNKTSKLAIAKSCITCHSLHKLGSMFQRRKLAYNEFYKLHVSSIKEDIEMTQCNYDSLYSYIQSLDIETWSSSN